MKTLKTLLGYFFILTLLSGCGMKHVNEPDKNEPLQNTTRGGDKQMSPKADFIPGFHPFKDDPDNPSPHNPLVRKFGDIPEVRTYIRLNQKFLYGIGLNIDEAIEFYTAEAHLYPTREAKARLKAWKKDKERYERQGISTGGIVMRMQSNTKADSGDKKAVATESKD